MSDEEEVGCAAVGCGCGVVIGAMLMLGLVFLVKVLT